MPSGEEISNALKMYGGGQAKALSLRVLQALQVPEGSFQVGLTKIFLRRSAYELLEFSRSRALESAAVAAQSVVRGAARRREYIKMRASALALQRVARGFAARRVAKAARARLFVARFLQRVRRGVLGRRVALARRREVSAVFVQAAYRSSLARRRYARFAAAVVALQCATRRRAARKELLKRRREFNDLGKAREEAEALKEQLKQFQLQAQELERKKEAERERKAEMAAAEAAALAAAAAKAEAEERVRAAEERERELQARLEREAEERRALEAEKEAVAADMGLRLRWLEGALLAARVDLPGMEGIDLRSLKAAENEEAEEGGTGSGGPISRFHSEESSLARLLRSMAEGTHGGGGGAFAPHTPVAAGAAMVGAGAAAAGLAAATPGGVRAVTSPGSERQAAAAARGGATGGRAAALSASSSSSGGGIFSMVGGIFGSGGASGGASQRAPGSARMIDLQDHVADLEARLRVQRSMLEQANSVKLALSRRLEQMIRELKEVRSVAGKLQRRVLKLQAKREKDTKVAGTPSGSASGVESKVLTPAGTMTPGQ